jgi:cytochrome P450
LPRISTRRSSALELDSEAVVTDRTTIPSFTDPAIHQQPFPLYDMLRARAPVYRSAELGLVLVTRYDDIVAVLRDPESFSSSYFARRTSGAHRSAAVAAVLASGYQGHDTLNQVDGPAHDFHAGIVRPFVSPRRVRALGERIQRIVDDAIASIPSGRPVDLIADFAEGVAIAVMCEFVGVSSEDRELWARGADAELALIGALLDEDAQLRYATDFVRMQQRIAQLIEDRRQDPRDDLLSAVVSAPTPEGLAPLSIGEMVRIVTATVVAGNETTRSLIASTIYRLCLDPELEARIRSTPQQIPELIEEMLRVEPPGIMIFRVATRDTQLRGVPITEGEMLGVVLASGNYDPEMFGCPYSVELDRANTKRHLTFGSGSHTCLGAPLAREEALIAVRSLLATFDRIELVDGPPPAYLPTYMIRSMRALPVVMHRSSGEAHE